MLRPLLFATVVVAPAALVVFSPPAATAADPVAVSAGVNMTVPLDVALERWTEFGGNIDKIIEPFRDSELNSRREADAVCKALEKIFADPKLGSPGIYGTRRQLIGFFEQVGGAAPVLVFRRRGLPLLRSHIRATLAKQPSEEIFVDVHDAMAMLAILVQYQQAEDAALIVAAARAPALDDRYDWTRVFLHLNDENDLTTPILAKFRESLPRNFCRVALLDHATNLALNEERKDHVFDSDDGAAVLEGYLRGVDPSEYSYAKSATAALPFVSAERRAKVLPLAEAHPDVSIRLEAAWVRAETGEEIGVRRLGEFCRSPLTADVAMQYLEELGRKDAIPKEAQDESFKALAQMARWLEHPNEFGRLPDKIEIFDTRELHWPPTNDKRRLWLVKYIFKGKPGEKDDEGVGMVGSITFALFGEATVDKRPEDIYALHCCWELESLEDERAPKERSVAAGRKLLGEKNSGF